MSPLGRSRADAGGRAASRKAGSSWSRSIPRRSAWTPTSTTVPTFRMPAFARRDLIPAHSANEAAVPGPNTCRYRRASRFPRRRRGRHRDAAPSRWSAPGHRPSGSGPCPSARRSAARSGGCPFHVPPRRSSSVPGEEFVKASRCVFRSPQRLRVVRQPPEREHGTIRAATTYALDRGPQTCTSDGSSQAAGPVPSTRAWIDSTAARGTLSCSPAHAARRRTRAPGGAAGSLSCPHPPPERENLRPGEDETRPHLTRLTARLSTQARLRNAMHASRTREEMRLSATSESGSGPDTPLAQGEDFFGMRLTPTPANHSGASHQAAQRRDAVLAPWSLPGECRSGASFGVSRRCTGSGAVHVIGGVFRRRRV